MLTASQSQQFRAAESGLDALTIARLEDLFGLLTMTDMAGGVLDTLPGLVSELGDVSGVLAVNAYELSRDQSDAAGRFIVDLADPPPVEQVEGASRWALAPLFQRDPEVTDTALRATLLDRLSGTVPRLVRDTGRRTTTDNAARDPAKPRYQRVLSPAKRDHCDFCRMLSGRGAVYHSEDTAGAGKHFHDRCGCRVELQFT